MRAASGASDEASPAPRPADGRGPGDNWSETSKSQSAFVRGFIDDPGHTTPLGRVPMVSIRVRARLHR